MKILQFLIPFSISHLVTATMLKCGEDIVVNRGEKKTLRFWSTDDELLRVEMVPDRGESDASALLAMFKDTYNKGSDIFGSRNKPVKLKGSLSSRNEEKDSLYRLDEKIVDNFKDRLSSEAEPPLSIFDNETQTTSVPINLEDDSKFYVHNRETINKTELETPPDLFDSEISTTSSVRRIENLSQMETETSDLSVINTPTTSSPIIQEEDTDFSDQIVKILNQMKVETKFENHDDNIYEIPKEMDSETSTQISANPETEIPNLQKQIQRLEKDKISSTVFDSTEETTTEIYQEHTELPEFSHQFEIRANDLSTQSEMEALPQQNYDRNEELAENYESVETTTVIINADKSGTSVPEVEITTGFTAMHETNEILDSTTDLPLVEEDKSNLRTDIFVDPLDEKLIEEFMDKITTTESSQDIITSNKIEDSTENGILETESSTMLGDLGYILEKELVSENKKATVPNLVTPSTEPNTENLEIHTTEPTLFFDFEPENKENSSNKKITQITSILENFQDKTTEPAITINATSESTVSVQSKENASMAVNESSSEIYIGNEDLKEIISELKSQEASLLKSPAMRYNHDTETSTDADDIESIDIKLSILQNIIREITSEIEAKEKIKMVGGERMDHIYLPNQEEDDFAKEEQVNEKYPEIGSVKSGKIHFEDSDYSLTTLRKNLLQKASKADLSSTNELILPTIYNSASLEKIQKDEILQNKTEDNNYEDVDTDLELQLTTAQSVNPDVFKTSNKNEEKEKEELNDTRSATKSQNTGSTLQELAIPLNLLKLFGKSDKENKSQDEEEKISDFMDPDNESQASSSSDDNNRMQEEIILNSEHTGIENMEKELVNVDESTTTSSIMNQIKTTTTISKDHSESFEEEFKNIKVDNNAIFGKETGTDKVLSLLKNVEKDIIDVTKQEYDGENSILLPSKLFSSKLTKDSQILSEPKSDNKVEIQEPGSKVVIIKPNSDILKAKKETDSFAVNTENGNYEVEIETATIFQQPISEDHEESSNKSDVNDFNIENVITDKSISDEENEVTTLLQQKEKITTESYIPFGIMKERDNIAPVDKTQSDEALAYGKIDTAASIVHELNNSDNTSENNSTISGNEDSSSPLINPSSDSVKKYTSENEEPEKRDDSINEDVDLGNFYDQETFDYNEASPQSEHLQRKIDTEINDETPSQEYLYNHRSEHPLPYVLQTRQGLVDPDEVSVRRGGVQNRRDDSQQTFGKDSPFFIKLPGAESMVPVFLQYEPVKVKYVNADKFFKKKPGTANDKTQTKQKVSNDVSSPTSMKILKTKTKDKYNPDISISKIPSDYLNVDFHLRPDPFYVMDPPNLGEELDENVKEENNEVESLAIDVEGKLGFNKDIPDPMKEGKPIYPGEYFIKNPDNSYSSSDTSSLTNPVFTLGSKVTLPPTDSGNLQYTPFPLTTNPPKRQTPQDSENEIESGSESPQQKSTTTEKNTLIIISDHKSNITENPPSIEYSPIPSIDYPDSYGPFEYIDIPFGENNDEPLYGDTSEPFSSPVPEKAAFVTDIKNEKLIDEPLKKNNDFDIVALANFLHQNQKVWSNPKATPNPETNSWRNPSWDDVIQSAEKSEQRQSDSMRNSGPWVDRRMGMGEERYYSAFHSPEEVPGLDPAHFSYRKMPVDVKEKVPVEDSNLSVEKRSSSEADGIMRYIETLPLIMQKAIINPGTVTVARNKRSASSAGEHVYCEWNIKTEPGLYLLVTFHNLSAPYTVDCYGAYIEVERENNGYDARWCGNRATVPGARPHVIFAKSEVRITVYDNGDAAKTYPTGFEAEIEVIDLFDTEEYKHFMEKKATPKIRRLMEG